MHLCTEREDLLYCLQTSLETDSLFRLNIRTLHRYKEVDLYAGEKERNIQ